MKKLINGLIGLAACLLTYVFYSIGFIILSADFANITSNNVPTFFSMDTVEILYTTPIGVMFILGGKVLFNAIQEESKPKTEQESS